MAVDDGMQQSRSEALSARLAGCPPNAGRMGTIRLVEAHAPATESAHPRSVPICQRREKSSKDCRTNYGRSSDFSVCHCVITSAGGRWGLGGRTAGATACHLAAPYSRPSPPCLCSTRSPTERRWLPSPTDSSSPRWPRERSSCRLPGWPRPTPRMSSRPSSGGRLRAS